jgi:hypothetical protein
MSLNLKRILNSDRGRSVLSILLGLGLATLFRKACDSKNCLVFRAPTLNNISNHIFGHNNKCFKYEEKSSTCNNDNGNTVLDIEHTPPST